MLLLGVALTVFSAIMLWESSSELIGIPMILGIVLIAIGVLGFSNLKSLSYTLWILASVVTSLFYPQYFLTIGTFKLSNLIVPLLQVIMFGMGTTMSLKDFEGVIKMPKGVLIGVICQFSIMIYSCLCNY